MKKSLFLLFSLFSPEACPSPINCRKKFSYSCRVKNIKTTCKKGNKKSCLIKNG